MIKLELIVNENVKCGVFREEFEVGSMSEANKNLYYYEQHGPQ